ncbi:MAG: DUF423 domain-containing protein [Acidobacteriota bacterium]
MTKFVLALGALLAAAAVAGGAFGAHGLKGRLEPQALAQWETAARYLVYAGLGTILAGLAALQRGGLFATAGLVLAAGGVVFACAVGGLALGAPRWFGAVAPLGGLGMIAGFLLFAVAALRL